MGHQIANQVSLGGCQFTECSCGRGALKIKDKMILLSSAEIAQMRRIFSGDVKGTPASALVAKKLNQLTPGKSWEDFSLPG